MIQDKAYDEIDRMWQRKEIENKELNEWDKKREYIRQYDNSKFGKPDWYGRKDYAPLTLEHIDERIKEIVMEIANGQS